jgi:hypothetical protein
VVVSAALAYRIWRPPRASEPTQPVTEKTLHAAIADLTTINSLLPPASTSQAPITSRSESDSVAFPSPLSWKQLLRLAASLTLPYLILTYFVRLRILLGIAGTAILTYRAPWAASLRRAFWASAHVRWGLYRLWSLLTGQPLPPAITPDSVRAASAASLTAASEPVAATPEPLRFIFTVHENQRWWMGLDWTGALLPGERPSWCAPVPSLAPLPPPAAFTLPSSSSAVVGGRHRVARWEWAEPEWRVSVRREAGVGSSRIERAPPAPEEPAPATGGGLASSGSRLFAKMRESVDIKHAPPLSPTSATFGPGAQPSSPAPIAAKDEQPRAEPPPPLDVEEEPLTDADGWVYGDNKWEGQSPKGGMGKVGDTFTGFARMLILSSLSTRAFGVGRASRFSLRRFETSSPARKSRSRASWSKQSRRPSAVRRRPFRPRLSCLPLGRVCCLWDRPRRRGAGTTRTRPACCVAD